jgi:hypothetical protein
VSLSSTPETILWKRIGNSCPSSPLVLSLLTSDSHLLPAEIPHEHPDVLIVESTYGTMNHSSREERETRFTSTVERVVRRGGNCLIPVFALGRAQELLLILDEYWRSSPDLHDIPIFYASRLASKALRVYQTFVNMMNLHIQVTLTVSLSASLTVTGTDGHWQSLSLQSYREHGKL